MYVRSPSWRAAKSSSQTTAKPRIPREFALNGPEEEIFRRGDKLVIREKPANVAHAFELLAGMPDDFLPEDRIDPPSQKRSQTRLLKAA